MADGPAAATGGLDLVGISHDYGSRRAVDDISFSVAPGEILGLLWPSGRSEEHTSELQSLMRISYAVFCLKKKNTDYLTINNTITNLFSKSCIYYDTYTIQPV